jgi:hypothetical protein
VSSSTPWHQSLTDSSDTYDPTAQLLAQLVDEGASIDGELFEVSDGSWAIHGNIPYGGEVILAEFESFELGTHTLACTPPNHPWPPKDRRAR